MRYATVNLLINKKQPLSSCTKECQCLGAKVTPLIDNNFYLHLIEYKGVPVLGCALCFRWRCEGSKSFCTPLTAGSIKRFSHFRQRLNTWVIEAFKIIKTASWIAMIDLFMSKFGTSQGSQKVRKRNMDMFLGIIQKSSRLKKESYSPMEWTASQSSRRKALVCTCGL